MASKLSAIELSEIENSTNIYDAFSEHIKKKVKEPGTFQRVLRLTQDFMSKNETKLATNIIGRRVLVNQKMEDDIYDAFKIDKKEVEEAIENSLYFKETFGRKLSLNDQLCLAFVLILASLEYKLIGKQDESDLCYLLAHFKPYSSRESLFFKYGVNEGQMLYTVENSLSERFDIKKYGTVLNALRKRAQSSYANYITDMKKTDKMTDKKLYVCYTSGIAGSVNTFIGAIVEVYRKNEGKSLDYESSIKGMMDKDADAMEYSDADIESDVAVRQRIINRVIIKVTKDPVDKKLISIACQYGFGSSSQMYIQMLTNLVTEITEKMFDELDPFFSALISAFLYNDNSVGRKYTMDDFRSPIFLNVGIDTLAGKKSNVKEVSLLTCRKIFNKMLEEHSIDYMNVMETTKRKFQKALAAYWVYLIRSTN